jgi:pilus assembly protein Flp/PilA
MLSIFRNVMKSDRGATAIEYTLIASLIAVAAIVAMKTVGNSVGNTLNSVSSTITAAG